MGRPIYNSDLYLLFTYQNTRTYNHCKIIIFRDEVSLQIEKMF